jgi:hypothetical protein
VLVPSLERKSRDDALSVVRVKDEDAVIAAFDLRLRFDGLGAGAERNDLTATSLAF